MAGLCEERGVKLLCYGTVLGGLLSEKWLGHAAPTKADFTTVSERKASVQVMNTLNASPPFCCGGILRFGGGGGRGEMDRWRYIFSPGEGAYTCRLSS